MYRFMCFFQKRSEWIGLKENNPEAWEHAKSLEKDGFEIFIGNQNGLTGLDIKFEDSTSIGIFEHFYDVNYWSTQNSNTHYIIEARLIKLETVDNKINLSAQHSNLEWINPKECESNDVHYYSNIYLNKIDTENFSDNIYSIKNIHILRALIRNILS